MRNPTAASSSADQPAPDITFTQDDAGLHAGTLTIPTPVLTGLIRYLEVNNQVIVIPPGLTPFGIACRIAMQTAEQNDRPGHVTALGRVLTASMNFLGLANAPKVNKKGAPRREGAVAAARAALAALTGFGTETYNAHLDPAQVKSQTDNLDVWWNLGLVLSAALQRVGRNAVPLSRTLVDGLRDLFRVVSPVLDTHPELALLLQPLISYLDGPHKKAGRTKADNKRKDQKLVQKTEATVLPKARDQARTEVRTQVEDKLSGLFDAAQVNK